MPSGEGYTDRMINHDDGLRIAGALELIAQAQASSLQPVSTWENIPQIIRAGLGEKVFPIGTQLIATHSVYGDLIFDVIGHNHDKSIHDPNAPTMTIQMHDVIYDTMFDAAEAMYYCEQALPAGTYNFTISTTWSKAIAGTYQFTLTHDVPAGGQIVGPYQIADKNPDQWTLSTYSSATSTTAIETVSVTSGSGGTNLGNITTPSGNINHIHRIGYGSNNWEESALRQWLNSEGAANTWWKAKTKFDRPCSYTSRPGFLAGFSEAFRTAIGECSHGNRTNGVFDLRGTNQAYETSEKVFVLCNEETGLAKEQGITCGTLYDYYKNATDADRIKYLYSDKVSPRYWWLRSPVPSGGFHERLVSTSGALNYNSAYDGYGAVAACVIY